MAKVLQKLKLETIFIIALTVFSFIVSVINISFPDHLIFDEVYRVVRAEKVLDGQIFFTAQPHFGRYLILLGILIFGDNPIGWRITQAVTSTLLVPVSFLIGKKLFKHKYAGLLSAFFVTFELAYLVYSRIGVVIIHQVFFVALSFLLFVLSTEENNKNAKLFYFLSAVTTGLSVAIKWTSLVLFPILWLWAKTKSGLQSVPVRKKILFLTVAACAYLVTFSGEAKNYEYYNQKYNMPNNNFVQGVISWHKLAFLAHARKHGDHPSSSRWYTWPFMYKPVLIYWKFDDVNSQVTSILGLGNPVIWWAGVLAILFQLLMLFFKRDKIIVFLLGTYFISFLPYVLIARPMFLYHYLPSLFFLILILEYTFVNLYKEKIFLRPVLISLIILVIAAFFYLYPFANGYPVSLSEYNHRLYFKSWKEYQISPGNSFASVEVKPTNY